jgi:hypothetical protein
VSSGIERARLQISRRCWQLRCIWMAEGPRPSTGCSPLRHPTAPTANENPAPSQPYRSLHRPRADGPTHATQPHRLKVCVESPILPSLGKFDAGGAVVIASARRFGMIGICLTLC